jgi:NDP-sugar pyrophosphorylase family protein
MQLIIPMTGVGQRFIDAGYKELKPLIQVDGLTYIEHILAMFPGVSDVLFIISKDHEQREILERKVKKIMPEGIISVIEAHKLGPSYAIKKSQDFVSREKKVIVTYCDYKAKWNFQEMINQLDSYDGSILTYTGFHPHMSRSNKYAYVKKVNQRVVDIQEKKPFSGNPQSEEASAGCYGFASGRILLSCIDQQIEQGLSWNSEFYTSLTYLPLLENDGKVGTVQASKFAQWGTPEDLEDWKYWVSAVSSLESEPHQNFQLKSTTIILAAGLGSRMRRVSALTKPNLVIGKKCLWEYSWEIAKHSEEKILVTRNAVSIKVDGKFGLKTINLVELTGGQAISAMIGLREVESDDSVPINILSSDNVVSEFYAKKALEEIRSCDLLVWVAGKYPPAIHSPKEYSWVEIGNLGEVLSLLAKKCPPNFENNLLIIGNFTFKSKDIAISLIEKLEQNKIQVKGEYYLDSVIEVAKKEGLSVKTMKIDDFFAIGSENEYLTFEYFSESDMYSD